MMITYSWENTYEGGPSLDTQSMPETIYSQSEGDTQLRPSWMTSTTAYWPTTDSRNSSRGWTWRNSAPTKSSSLVPSPAGPWSTPAATCARPTRTNIDDEDYDAVCDDLEGALRENGVGDDNVEAILSEVEDIRAPILGR